MQSHRRLGRIGKESKIDTSDCPEFSDTCGVQTGRRTSRRFNESRPNSFCSPEPRQELNGEPTDMVSSSSEVGRVCICMQQTWHLPNEEQDQAKTGSGKRNGRAAIAPGISRTHHSTPIAINSLSGTLSILETHTNRRFLIDSGADISVFPATQNEKSGKRTTTLLAANGSRIPTYGNKVLPLRFGTLEVEQSFCLAEVAKPLLGADFFIKNELIIDLKNGQLLRIPHPEQGAQLVVKAEHGSAGPMVGILSVDTEIAKIVEEFPAVLETDYAPDKMPGHGVQHVVPTTGPPIFSRPRPLHGEKLEAAKQEFNKLREAGIIRPSSSAWASPLHMVSKSDGSWRPCGDYRRLNAVTEDDRYPLPLLHTFSSVTAGAKMYSVLDLVKGYHQIPMDSSDIAKTAITTPFGLFEYLRMPFGLKNAAQAFQRLMDNLFRAVPFVFIYLDDILIASESKNQHVQHVREVLSILQTAGLSINRDKCVWGQNQVKFLGHTVTPACITPLEDKVSAIRTMPLPGTKVLLQRFLGCINFYN